MPVREITIGLHARPYQRELIDFFRKGGKHAFEFWHRKAGKDRAACFVESELSFRRPGLYWHALPKYEEARKVIWDAITPEGTRLIDEAFPDVVCRKKNAHEMKIETIYGSIWQLTGADNFNSLVGASPVHVTYSEFALMHPNARQFIRPAIAQNNGSELFISTVRGYNHASDLYEYAKAHPWSPENPSGWHSSLLTVDDTGIMLPEVLEEERRTMPDELFRQEYMCDRSAANVGSIMGRYIEAADKEGRISDDVEIDPEGAELELSMDIGRRDAFSCWYWQPRLGGFDLVDHDEAIGLVAEDAMERIHAKGYRIGAIWLPHDARNKTFTARHSPLEQFIDGVTKSDGTRVPGFGNRVHIVPREATSKRINAARTIAPRCCFNRSRCADGLAALREWQYEYNAELKRYSVEPLANWAIHAGDGYSYGCQMMQQRVLPAKRPTPREKYIEAVRAAQRPITFDEALKRDEQRHNRRHRV
jgi:hypothetical protein